MKQLTSISKNVYDDFIREVNKKLAESPESRLVNVTSDHWKWTAWIEIDTGAIAAKEQFDRETEAERRHHL